MENGSGSNASCGSGGNGSNGEWQMKLHVLTHHSFPPVGLVLNRPGTSTCFWPRDWRPLS